MENYQKYFVIILVIGLFLRVYAALNIPIINTDELLYMAIAVGTSSSSWARLSTLFHGPLYFYFVDFAFRLLGTSYFSARLLSVIISILSIPLVYTIGSELHDRRTGLFAAFLLAISSAEIIFGSTSYLDVIVSTFILLAIVFLILYTKSNNNLYLGGFFAALAIAINTKVIALYFLPALAVLFLSYKQKLERRNLLLPILFFIFLMLPIPAYNYFTYNSKGLLDLHMTSLLRPESSLKWFQTHEIITDETKWYENADMGASTSEVLGSLLKYYSLPLLFLAAAGIFISFIRHKSKDIFVLTWLFIPLLLFSLYIFHEYYMIYLAPPISLLAASVITSIQGNFKKGKQPIVLACMLFIIFAGELVILVDMAKGKDATYQVQEYIQQLPKDSLVVMDEAIWTGEIAWIGASGDKKVMSLFEYYQGQQKLMRGGTARNQTVYYVQCASNDCGARGRDAASIERSEAISEEIEERGTLLKEFSNKGDVNYSVYELQLIAYPFGNVSRRFMEYGVGHPEKSIDVYEIKTPFESILNMVAHLSLWINILIALISPFFILWILQRGGKWAGLV